MEYLKGEVKVARDAASPRASPTRLHCAAKYLPLWAAARLVLLFPD